MEVTIFTISCMLECCTMYYGPMTWYYLLLLSLLSWKENCAFCFATSLIFVMEKEEYGLRGIIEQPLSAILDLSMYMMDHRFSLLQDMCLDFQPWISIFQYLIENEVIKHGRIHCANYWWMYSTLDSSLFMCSTLGCFMARRTLIICIETII